MERELKELREHESIKNPVDLWIGLWRVEPSVILLFVYWWFEFHPFQVFNTTKGAANICDCFLNHDVIININK